MHRHPHRPVWPIAASLAAIVAAVALPVALSPAGAFAVHGHPRHHGRGRGGVHASVGARNHTNGGTAREASAGGRCHITIQAEPHLIAAGETTSVFGALKCSDSISVAGQQVTLYGRSARSGSFSVAGTTTTEAGGSYELTPPEFETNTVFYVRSGNARSVQRTVRVAVQVTPVSQPADGAQLFTAAGPTTGVARHPKAHQVTFTGRVSPVDAGSLVRLQRENATASEEWRLIGSGMVNSRGEYSIEHVFYVPGDANIRIVVQPPSQVNAPGATSPVSYEISETQNPQLTIGASADPISYGGSVTISGVLAGGANQPVKLLAHTRGGKFAPVATATTDSSGNYTFTQSPSGSIFYEVMRGTKVKSGTTRSAVLFEGVKYALGPVTPSASTVQAGQPFTVSGTVAPGRAGHVIYLERQNPSKLGYHVVEVATVTGAGTYSITHTFYGVTTGAVLRVKIPGDPENQGVASPAFTLAVTAAPASSLMPAPTGRLPSEEQT